MKTDNVDGVLKLLQDNDNYDEVADDLRDALTIAEKSKYQQRQMKGQDGPSSGPPESKRPPQQGKPMIDDTLIPASPGNAAKIICKQFCGLGFATSIHPKWISLEIQERQMSLLKGERHLILPYVVANDSPLSLAFSNFIDAVKHMQHQGVSLSTILGSLDTEVDLLFRPRCADDPYTACTWACDLARLYAHINVFTQLAIAFLLSRFMRWVLDPTLENYILLPDIMKPTNAQGLVPHFASADLFPLPTMRESLIRGELKLPKAVGSPDGFGVKLNWPFELNEAVDRDPVTGTARVSRLLAACASDPRYWSCNEDFLESFPEVKDHLNVITHKHDWKQLKTK